MKLLTNSFAALVLSGTVIAGSFHYERLDREKAVVAIVDHQVGLYLQVHDIEATLFRQNVLNHALMAKAFDLPVVLTTSTHTGPNGPLPKEITDLFPDAPLIHRDGEVNAMDSPEFREALAATNRTQVIIGGILTDVCTTFAALSMREAGYAVFANHDASGTGNLVTATEANNRMRDAGVHLVSTGAIFGELMRDWREAPTGLPFTPFFEGLSAIGAMTGRAHAAAVENGTIREV